MTEPRLTPLAHDPMLMPISLLCPAYVVRDCGLDGLYAAARLVKTRHPGTQARATLDDLGQACYTCMQSIAKASTAWRATIFLCFSPICFWMASIRAISRTLLNFR